MAQHIEIHIDRIVLDGYDPIHAPAIREAIRESLALLVAQSGLPGHFVQNTHIRQVQGGPMEAAGNHSVHQIGAGIARSVYQGIHNLSLKQR
jgi:hypothetical protein